MAISIGDALLKIGVDKKDFDRDMTGLSGAIERHKKAIGAAMIGVGVAALGAAVDSVKAFANMGDEVQKMAIRTGFSTEALSELRHAAEISGASLGTLEKGVKRMSGTILDAKDGMETYIRAFEHIGIEVQELDGLNPEQQFLRIAEAIAEVEDPTMRAALAQDIFGRAGTELLPLFAQGKEGLADLRKEAHKLGIVFDKEAAESAANFKDSLTRLNGAITGVKFTLAKELMPALEAGVPLLETWAKALGPIIENTFNWYAAEDKQKRMHDAWAKMAKERSYALQGLAHDYGAAVDALESTLYSQGLLGKQQEELIKKLREEIKVRGLHKKAIEDENEAYEDQIALQKEQQEQYDKTTEMIEEAIKELEYERSTAGKLRIKVDDVIKSLHLMGMSNEKITATLISLGTEQDNVLKVLEAFGITALEVADMLGIQIDEVERLGLTYENLKEKIDKTTESYLNQISAAGEAAAAAAGIGYGHGAIEPGMSPYQKAYAMGISEEEYERRYGLQAGGIVMRPISARIAEKQPEAVIPLDRMNGLMGTSVTITGNNFYVRKESDIDKIGEAIVAKIRLKTGVKI